MEFGRPERPAICKLQVVDTTIRRHQIAEPPTQPFAGSQDSRHAEIPVRVSGVDAAVVKISGGVKTVTDAAQYINLTESMMGKGWISTDKFRIGASGVLNDILVVLGKQAPPATAPKPGY